MKKYVYDLKLDDIRLTKLSGAMRFNTYRYYEDGEDCDRSKTVLEIYDKLGWFNKDFVDLEPDTMFSPWVIERLLLKKYDNDFYIKDYKKWIVEVKKLDYDNMSNSLAKHLRFEWLLLDRTVEHYSEIFSSPILNKFLENVHTIGNFWIVPKGHDAYKCKKFNDSPIKAIGDILRNFSLYRDKYSIFDKQEFLTKFILRFNPFIDYTITNKDSIEMIFKKLEHSNRFIEKRSSVILGRLNSFSHSVSGEL